MSPASPPIQGLKLGFVCITALALFFLAIFIWPGGPHQGVPPAAPPVSETTIEDVLSDRASQNALKALREADPATYTTLITVSQRITLDTSAPNEIAALLLEALFGQFRQQAYSMQFARPEDYRSILRNFAEGVRSLETQNNRWCQGSNIARYLSHNEDELVPILLTEFPYGTEQFTWAMDFMADLLERSHLARLRPQQHLQPTAQDERILQAVGLQFGTEAWDLALQIGAFANTEGRGFAPMQDMIASMDVCRLALAVETVDSRLPPEVSGRIWADLMPEIMVGNTPYALSRIMDYFFVG